MMKYFAIESSLNEKFMGKIPQVKEYIHNCHVYDEPKFIGRFSLEKIEIQPILSNAVLYSNAKQTDFINTYGDVGFSFGNLISNKFKDILDKFNCYGFQFFKTYLVQKNQKFETYWQSYKYDFPYQYIDFERTTFLFKDRDIDKNIINQVISFNTIDEFLLFTNKIRYPKWIFFKDISFTENMDLDFFALRYTEGGHNGVVSEKLKIEIEKEGLTGIEFRPIEISLSEWQKRDGLREQVYGRSW